MGSVERGRWSDAARLAGLALLLTPLTILIHELGHLSVPLVLGLPAELHPTTVLGGAGLGEAPGWMAAAQSGAGPIVTIAMSLGAAYLFARPDRPLWALAAAVAAAHRFVVTTGYLLVRLFLALIGQPYRGTPNFDEHVVAEALGFSPIALALMGTGFLVGFLVWLMRKVSKGRRFLYFLALAAGIIAGHLLWATLAPAPLFTIIGG